MDCLLISSGSCSSEDWEGFNDLEFSFYYAIEQITELMRFTLNGKSASPAVLWVLEKIIDNSSLSTIKQSFVFKQYFLWM